MTDSRFDVPATVAEFGSRLYLANARFSFTSPPVPPTPDMWYNAVAIPRP
nr:hypothetical protein [Kibdelosporangium sp. MJ126-NF4]CEL18937.1 hypothetical protein [Kibdelosporangium sp. MJ126-NF4]